MHTRDLGTHLSTGCRLVATTLCERLKQAVPLANKIGRVPATEKQKVVAVKAKVNKLALYGPET